MRIPNPRSARGLTGPALALLLLQPPIAAWAQDSAYSHRKVERVRDPLLGRADIGGRVYEDRGREGFGPEDAPGIPDVVVALDDGRFAVTGPDGWWRLSEIAPGQRSVSLREGTLPLGGVAPGRRMILEAPPGAFVRLDFPVKIRAEKVEVGQEEVLGHRAFPRFEEIPASVVGNVTDIQVLINGMRQPFPRAELDIVGLSREGFVRPGAFRRVAFTLSVEAEAAPTEWRVSIVDTEGSLIRELEGEGRPPRRLSFDGRDADGEPLSGPRSFAARLCVEHGPDVAACSPYRPFGVLGIERRQEIQPMLDLPRSEAVALISGEPAPLDEDGSFILPVRLDESRAVEFSLTREDGREARTVSRLPGLEITSPQADFGVEWGVDEEIYSSPEEPGPIRVRLRGTTEPPEGRLRLGTEAVPIRDGRWETEIEVPLGDSRFELTLADQRGFNVLRELHFSLANETPDGEPVVLQPRIPALEVLLPSEDEAAWRRDLRLRGRAATDTRVTANGVVLELDPEGGFDAVVELRQDDGEILIVAVDDQGREARVSRSWTVIGGETATGAFVDAEPFIRLIHDGAEGESATRLGLAGGASASVQRFSWRGASAFAGLSAAPDDRPSGSSGSLARAAVYGGSEIRLGDRFTAGLRYDGAAFISDDAEAETLSMRHDARLSGALHGEAFDVLLDAGADSGIPHVAEAGPLAGGGIGFRLRAGRAFEVRARAGALIALSDLDDGVSEILDGSAQLTYRSPRPSAPLVAIRYAHIEDNRRVHPEAAGDVVQVALAWPLHDRLRLLQSAGGWMAGEGGFTGITITRLEVDVLDGTLVAVDYRLLTQSENRGHTVTLEGARLITPWLRVGGLYQFDTNDNGGETGSRLQARLQAHF